MPLTPKEKPWYGSRQMPFLSRRILGSQWIVVDSIHFIWAFVFSISVRRLACLLRREGH